MRQIKSRKVQDVREGSRFASLGSYFVAILFLRPEPSSNNTYSRIRVTWADLDRDAGRSGRGVGTRAGKLFCTARLPQGRRRDFLSKASSIPFSLKFMGQTEE